MDIEEINPNGNQISQNTEIQEWNALEKIINETNLKRDTPNQILENLKI